MHLVWDTETHKMRNGLAAPPGVCLSYTELDTEAGTQTAPALMKWSEAIEFMSDNLPNSSIRWVGHNLCYDFVVVAAAAPRLLPLVFRAYEENRVFDTLARDKLQLLAIGLLADENETGAKRKERFSLDAVILRRFGHLMTNEAREAIVREKKDKNSWRLRYRELEDVPLADWPPDAVSYAKNDAYWSGRVFLDQEREQLARHGTTYIPDEFGQYRAMWWLQLARVWGVRTDAVAVSALAEDLQHRLEHTDKRLKRIGILKGKHAKGQVHWSKDTKKLKEFVVRAYGSEDATPKTDKGGISTEKDTLLAAPEHHLPECTFSLNPKTGAKENYVCAETCITGALHAVAERNGIEKVLNTNVPEFRLGTQMPICPNWNFLVATGRTSVGFWQNPPRKGAVRECVVPRPGFRFVSADWSFIELVTLSQICLDRFGFSKMAEAINLGMDPHLDLAADLLGISYEEAVARKGELLIKDQRQRSKAANFGLPGGLGAEKFKEYSRTTYNVNMTVEEAKALKPRWLRKWPEMVLHLRYSADRTQMGQSFTLVQPRSKRLRGDCGYTDGSNSCFQGLAADGAKHAGWFIAKECYLEDPYGNGSGPTALYGCRTVLFLHDEFILEVPEHRDHEAAMRLVDVMQRAMAAFCPDVKNKAEPALMNRWYKGAEPVYDKPKDDPTRRLIPWEPSAK